jgi:hypothetical protein
MQNFLKTAKWVIRLISIQLASIEEVFNVGIFRLQQSLVDQSLSETSELQRCTGLCNSVQIKHGILQDNIILHSLGAKRLPSLLRVLQMLAFATMLASDQIRAESSISWDLEFMAKLSV